MRRKGLILHPNLLPLPCLYRNARGDPKREEQIPLLPSAHAPLHGYKAAKSTGAPRFAFSPFTQGLPHIIANETSVYITRSFPTHSICSLEKKLKEITAGSPTAGSFFCTSK